MLSAEARQDAKWGSQRDDLDDKMWLAILVEEVGEVAKSTLEGYSTVGVEEIIQVAAVATQWLDAIGRREAGGGHPLSEVLADLADGYEKILRGGG